MNVTERQPLRCEVRPFGWIPVAAAQVLGFSARFAFGNFFKCLKVTIVHAGRRWGDTVRLTIYLSVPAGRIPQPSRG